MPLENCSTCKFWDKSDEGEIGANLDLGCCQQIPMFWAATKWAKDGESREFLDRYKDTKAFAQDGSDYKAYLLTKPDFGCVSYIQKV